MQRNHSVTANKTFTSVLPPFTPALLVMSAMGVVGAWVVGFEVGRVVLERPWGTISCF